ncbi:methyltransferase [Nocardia wallacei]|uniref:methyltransferase n=1 Tax=Nocardia wallacei TaxID=480035 RepID=UPI002458EFF8|nr:methyltransferase [Nocardia wallacei]
MATAEQRGQIIGLVFGQMAGQLVATAARLHLADALGDGARSGAEIAEIIGTHDLSTTRMCRALAAFGLLTETEPGRFRLTDTGALLRTDRPDSLNSFVQMFSDPAMQAAWGELGTAVQTGKPSFDTIFGVGFFDYLAAHPHLSAQFNVSMRQGTAATARILPQHYAFADFPTVADIGGGDGTLLAAVLGANPDLRGILYDTAEGLAQAAETLSAQGVSERCAVVTGDFFAAAPAGADLYLLKSIMHDWDDERAAVILGHIERVLPAGGRVLIIEPILPDVVDDSVPRNMYISDLNMLVNLGGRERTRAEFETLCATAGLAVSKITQLPPPLGVSLIEAKRA